MGLPEYELDWTTKFNPYYGDMIDLPKGLIFWRAYETNVPSIDSRPSQYSSKEVATSYASLPNRTLGAFCTTQSLRLLDARFLTVLLQKAFEARIDIPHIPSEAMCIRATTITFGLCSAAHQIKLMKHQYAEDPENLSRTIQMEQTLKKKSLIEPPGVYIQEPVVNGIAMTFLKGLFRFSYDGILIPLTNEDRSTIELVLFDPKGDGIAPVKTFTKELSKRRIHEFTSFKRPSTTGEATLQVSRLFSMPSSGCPTLEEFNTRLTNRDTNAHRLAKQAEEVGSRWCRKFVIYSSEPPHPCIPVSMFHIDRFELN
jgi:hypothetical protein